MKGYKVFNPDWTCRGFQYEVGKIYETDKPTVVCQTGFHFCERAADCFDYYRFDSGNKVAEVVAHGEVLTEDNKSCTNKIEIVREIPWLELLTIVNTGTNNTGLSNTGHRNTGHRNTGDRNTGHRNTGDRNTGYRNTGDRNTGDYNTGDRNTGDFNFSNNNAGCFCTGINKILLFDKISDFTFEQWRESEAYQLLSTICFEPVEWIGSNTMTDSEKAAHPERAITGGFLRKNDTSKCYSDWWEKLSKSDKNTIKAIPNFDAEKFYKITGIKVEE